MARKPVQIRLATDSADDLENIGRDGAAKLLRHILAEQLRGAVLHFGQMEIGLELVLFGVADGAPRGPSFGGCCRQRPSSMHEARARRTSATAAGPFARSSSWVFRGRSICRSNCSDFTTEVHAPEACRSALSGRFDLAGPVRQSPGPRSAISCCIFCDRCLPARAPRGVELGKRCQEAGAMDRACAAVLRAFDAVYNIDNAAGADGAVGQSMAFPATSTAAADVRKILCRHPPWGPNKPPHAKARFARKPIVRHLFAPIRILRDRRRRPPKNEHVGRRADSLRVPIAPSRQESRETTTHVGDACRPIQMRVPSRQARSSGQLPNQQAAAYPATRLPRNAQAVPRFKFQSRKGVLRPQAPRGPASRASASGTNADWK